MIKDEKKSVLELTHDTVRNNAEIYKDLSNVYYCKPNDKSIVIPVDSEEFITYTCSLLRKQTGTYIKREDIKNLRPHLKDEQEVTCLDFHISKRCAFHNGMIYIDTINEIIQISRKGVSFIKKTPLPYFKRSPTMLPLVKPDLSSKPNCLLNYIDRHFAITFHQKILLCTWLVCSFISFLSLPILTLTGSKGSGKTSLTKRIRAIIDANTDETIVIPSNERDFAILLDSTYLLAIDNISDGDIKGKYSDLLSTAITKGSSYSVRQLYTDNGIVSLNLECRIILNGISQNLLRKSDALDRTLLLSMSRMPVKDMVSMNKLDEMFYKDLPSIFGSICNTLSAVLNIIDDIEITNISRMSDYAKYGYAVCEILGVDGDVFLEIYQENLNSINDVLLQDNVIAFCIMKIMKDRDFLQESVTELFLRVKEVAKACGVNIRELPGSPSHFSNKLFDIQSNLKDSHIELNRKNVGKYKEITIQRMK